MYANYKFVTYISFHTYYTAYFPKRRTDVFQIRTEQTTTATILICARPLTIKNAERRKPPTPNPAAPA